MDSLKLEKITTFIRKLRQEQFTDEYKEKLSKSPQLIQFFEEIMAFCPSDNLNVYKPYKVTIEMFYWDIQIILTAHKVVETKFCVNVDTPNSCAYQYWYNEKTNSSRFINKLLKTDNTNIVFGTVKSILELHPNFISFFHVYKKDYSIDQLEKIHYTPITNRKVIEFCEKIKIFVKSYNDPVDQFDAMASEFTYATPSIEILQTIEGFTHDKTCLEIGSGFGVWSMLLQSCGVKIIATDINLPRTAYCDIKKLSHLDALEQYPSQVLMLCWPEQYNKMAYESLLNFKGNYVIFIGHNGSTATDEFFWLLDCEWQNVLTLPIPKILVDDSLNLFIRKT